MISAWQRFSAYRRTPSVATMPVVALTTGAIYLAGGLCVLAVVLIDPPQQHRLWLTVLPLTAVVAGIVTVGIGRWFPRWIYHGCVISGNALVTAEILIGHGQPVVGATMPIYVFVVLDAAFFFPLVGLCFHLAHVLIVTSVVLPRVDVPWQSVITFNGVCVGVGIVVAYICRVADGAEEDPLTGLANRRGLDRRLQQALERADSTGLCLVLLDLDGFKEINDTQGHQRGDELLQRCADRWQRLLPKDVALGRYGGDEFGLIAPGQGLAEAAALADRLRTAVPLGVSAGVASWEHGDTLSVLVSRADVALYDAKTSGRGQTAVYGDPGRAASDLEEAVARGEMVLHYQPVVRLADRAVMAREALVRWRHPEHGLVSPIEFVPQAERTGAIDVLGAWVLEQVCRVLAEGAMERVSVNVSVRELRAPTYSERVRETLARHGVGPSRLILEVTEAVYDEGDPQVVQNLQEVRDNGVLIAVDDFGSGYSSLRWLDRLPLDILKIDGTFVDAIREDVTEAPILDAIIAMARALGIRVIAERVETEHQAHVLHDLGCEYAQGYLFGRPLPLSAGSAAGDEGDGHRAESETERLGTVNTLA